MYVCVYIYVYIYIYICTHIKGVSRRLPVADAALPQRVQGLRAELGGRRSIHLGNLFSQFSKLLTTKTKYRFSSNNSAPAYAQKKITRHIVEFCTSENSKIGDTWTAI